MRGSNYTVNLVVKMDDLFDRFKSVRGKTSELAEFDEVRDRSSLSKGLPVIYL